MTAELCWVVWTSTCCLAVQAIVRDKCVSTAAADPSFNSVVQLALHCVNWATGPTPASEGEGKRGGGVPQTRGELAWAQHFVGPLVSQAFHHLFARGSTLTWVG